MQNNAPTASFARKVGLSLLVFVLGQAGLCWFWPMPLFDPDEALYANITRTMIDSGDYLTPRREGTPFFDRPILHYWLLAASVRALGDRDFAWRLPSLLCGLVMVLSLYWVGRQLFDEAVGSCSALLLATMPAGIVVSLAVGHDSSLLAIVTTTVAVGLAWLKSPGRAHHWALTTGCLLGWGCLAKGLLGILLPTIPLTLYAMTFVLSRHRFKEIPGLLLALLLVGGSWYARMEWNHPGFLQYFIVQRHMMGYLTQSQPHGGRGLMTYVPVLLLGALPWGLLLFGELHPRKLRQRWQHGSWPTGASRVIVGWFLITLVFFLSAGSRNPTYLLPIFPPWALLLGQRLAPLWMALPSSESPAREFTGGRTFLSALTILPYSGLAVVLVVPIFLVLCWSPLAPTFGFRVAFLILVSLAMIGTINGFTRGQVGQSRWSPWTAQWFCTWLALATVVGLGAPAIVPWRSAVNTTLALRSLPEVPAQVWWYFHVPPSARHYAPHLSYQRVYWNDLQQKPTRPVVFVCRVSRLREVRATPFLAGARHVDLGGKYHLFFCGPSRRIKPDTLPNSLAN